jgi:hypothetical protein
MAMCHVDISPCPIITKKVALRGYFCLLQAPFCAAAAGKCRLLAPFQSGVVAGAARRRHIGRCLCGGSEDVGAMALMMHHAHNSQINTNMCYYF